MRYHQKFLVLAGFLPAAFAAEIPVKQVILYKHGVGYFERAGALAAGETGRLDFKTGDMNDVLKSLTIEEKGGGKVTGVRYDSDQPLDRKLAEFPFKLTAQMALPQLLDQVKGARLELKTGGQTVAGAIAGARVSPATNSQPEKQEVTLLVDSGELRTFDLAAAGGVRFTDPELQQKFKDYLAALSASRAQDKRSVYIDSTDRASRQIAVSYMIPMPAWKSSYRLIFGAQPEPTLEGWAIVDNTTGDDWFNVRLALVSGRPISFISRLYEPKYIDRPVAELPEDRAQGPVVHEGALAGLGGGAPLEMAMRKAAPAPPPAARSMAMAANFAQEARADMPSSVAVETQTRELGDLFEYGFTNPVTVRKNESAMLPFLQQKVAARKLLIYSGESAQNPMSAAEITNSTAKTLDGGPITVFDGNAYGGEALMETLKAGDKRLISYGVDLGTRVTTKLDSKSSIVREIHLNRGLLTSRFAREDVKTYTVRNVDQKAKTLVIECPIRPRYTLLSPKAAETTANHYRFEVRLAAGATATLPVTEEYVFDSTTSVVNLTPDAIGSYTQNKVLSDAARKQLERIVEQKRRIAAADQEIARTTTDIAEVDRDQQRLRQNIDSLNRVAGQQEQVQKYAKQLADQESKLAQLRDQQSVARKQKAVLEAELNRLLETLSF
jgi:hypothetical protein